MKEREELEKKKEIVRFIKENFELEGDEEKVNEKVRILATGIFELFYPPEIHPGNPELEGGVIHR